MSLSAADSPGAPARAEKPGAFSKPRPSWWYWYRLPEWRRLRRYALERHPTCRFCHAAASAVADHIEPHRGDWKLFTDLSNLQGLCEHCHNGKKLRIEKDIIRDKAKLADGWVTDKDGWLVRRRTAGEKRRTADRRRRRR